MNKPQVKPVPEWMHVTPHLICADAADALVALYKALGGGWEIVDKVGQTEPRATICPGIGPGLADPQRRGART